MPTYDYRCNACGRRVTLRYKTYAEYDQATPICSHCGSADLARLISRVAIKRSAVSRLFDGGWDDDAALDELEHGDPRTMGRMLRELGDEMGEDAGPEFDEIVGRLEHGESPEEIEKTLPDALLDDGPPALPSFDDD
jgi:putative FmdB family regulatory protein